MTARRAARCVALSVVLGLSLSGCTQLEVPSAPTDTAPATAAAPAPAPAPAGQWVTGDVSFNDGGADNWQLGVRGCIVKGRLSFSSEGTLPSQGVIFAVESFDAALSGTNGMTGDFVFRFSNAANGINSGSVAYKAKLVSMIK